MFGRLKDWRRVATRYDRCPIYGGTVLLIAGVLIALGARAPAVATA